MADLAFAKASVPVSPMHSRRQFVRSIAAAGLGVFAGSSLTRLTAAESAEPQPKRKFGVALVGLGSYSTHQLAPALQETKFCRLAAIVTGSPDKIPVWQKRYSLPSSCVYNYENFDRIVDNPEVDIVYVVTPNALHRDFVVRAAKAGKHVICEKPMATTVEDCDAMINACRDAKRQLAIGYRLHYEPYNLEMARFGTQKVFGALKHIKMDNGFIAGGDNWRFKRALSGGGPLMDMGIYCVQAACYVVGQDPISISAKELPKTRPEFFTDIEETIIWSMEFPGGLKAGGRTSYNENTSLLHVDAEDGWFELHPAYGYLGLAGKTSKGPINLPHTNHQAVQMDAFASDLLANRPNIVPGEMGRRDVRYLLAIYEAARTGKPVSV